MEAQITTTTTTTALLGKRKRTQVSYAVDDIFDQLGLLEDFGIEVDDEDDEDSVPSKRSKRNLKKAAKPQKPQKPFPFLSLPSELRDEIYKLCLVDPNDIFLTHRFLQKRRIASRCQRPSDDGRACPKCCFTHPPPTTLVPNLLAVNKQIHSEAVAFLYQQPMTAPDTTSLTAFLGAIGPRRRPLLRDITIGGWARDRSMQLANNYAAMTLLADCPELHALRFNCRLGAGWRSNVRTAAEGLYRDGYVFFHAFAAAKGAKADAALEILKFGRRCAEENKSSRRWGWSHSYLPQDWKSEDWQERFMEELRGCLLKTKKAKGTSKK